MKVLLFGAGAVGSFYSSKLAKDHQVSVVCRSNYSMVRDHGFIIKNSLEQVFKPFAVYSCIEEITQYYDLVIIATKADQFIDVSKVLHDNTIILIIQNGLGVEDKYAKLFPNTCILSAVTVISCAQTSPGVITHYSWTRIHIGPFVTMVTEKTGMEKAILVVDMFKNGGIHDAMACGCEELQMIRWHKLAINAAFNPTAVLSDGSCNLLIIGYKNSETVNHILGKDHARKVMQEVFDAARVIFGKSFPSSFASIDAILNSTTRNPEAKSSMLLDWEANKTLEIDAILRVPIEKAREHGISMPRLETMYSLISMKIDKRSKL